MSEHNSATAIFHEGQWKSMAESTVIEYSFLMDIAIMYYRQAVQLHPDVEWEASQNGPPATTGTYTHALKHITCMHRYTHTHIHTHSNTHTHTHTYIDTCTQNVLYTCRK